MFNLGRVGLRAAGKTAASVSVSNVFDLTWGA